MQLMVVEAIRNVAWLISIAQHTIIAERQHFLRRHLEAVNVPMVEGDNKKEDDAER